MAVDIAAVVVLCAALGAAHRHPRAAWALAATVLVVATAARSALPGGGDSVVAYLLVAAHAFATGRWDAGRSAVAGLLALISAGVIASVLASDPLGAFVFIPLAAWGAGRALRERSLVAEQLAQRASELEDEREAYAKSSVRYERARIASELHDIVAHAISVMVVQATAGQRLAASDPELAAETFATISGAARQAEEDMGRLVALLGDEHAIAAAPDVALIEELVARAAGSGLDVTLRLEGEREGLPTEVGELAYRSVQEALTNALRYASGAAVRVAVRGATDALVVEVLNGPAPSDATLTGTGTGNGLRGIRERVTAAGGTLDAGPTRDGGWRLTARLPRRVPTTAGG